MTSGVQNVSSDENVAKIPLVIKVFESRRMGLTSLCKDNWNYQRTQYYVDQCVSIWGLLAFIDNIEKLVSLILDHINVCLAREIIKTIPSPEEDI